VLLCLNERIDRIRHLFSLCLIPCHLKICLLLPLFLVLHIVLCGWLQRVLGKSKGATDWLARAKRVDKSETNTTRLLHTLYSDSA
jgi:hypothetical protein